MTPQRRQDIRSIIQTCLYGMASDVILPVKDVLDLMDEGDRLRKGTEKVRNNLLTMAWTSNYSQFNKEQAGLLSEALGLKPPRPVLAEQPRHFLASYSSGRVRVYTPQVLAKGSITTVNYDKGTIELCDDAFGKFHQEVKFDRIKTIHYDDTCDR